MVNILDEGGETRSRLCLPGAGKDQVYSKCFYLAGVQVVYVTHEWQAGTFMFANFADF